MVRALRVVGIVAVWLAVASMAAAATVTLRSVSVQVVGKPSPTANVGIAFRPQRLPHGGYYYAVIVLGAYTYRGTDKQPPCAVSSNMQLTGYGFPHGTGQLRLTLTPAPSAERAWCAGATYAGAVYAVPHRPSCSGYYRCSGGAAQCTPVCGVVISPTQHYRGYPGGLPKPVDASSRIVGRFTVTFTSG